MNIKLRALYKNNFISFGNSSSEKRPYPKSTEIFPVRKLSIQQRFEEQIKAHFRENKPVTVEFLMLVDDWVKQTSPRNSKRLEHSRSTAKTAMEIAEIVGYTDPLKAGLAAWLHDIGKTCEHKIRKQKFSDEKREEVAQKFEKLGVHLHVIDWEHESGLHAPIGTLMAKIKLGLNDQEVLDAIRNHTRGPKVKDESILKKIIFVADKIDAFKRGKDIYHNIMAELKESKNIDAALKQLKGIKS